jgi:hypothetical protein
MPPYSRHVPYRLRLGAITANDDELYR